MGWLALRQRITDRSGQPDIQLPRRIRIDTPVGIARHIGRLAGRQEKAVHGAIGKDPRKTFGLVLEGDKAMLGIRRPEEGGTGTRLKRLGWQFAPIAGLCHRGGHPHI